jgi:hypothetical protein
VKLELQPTRIAAADADGFLVFSDVGLVAVLVQLSSMHGEAAGQWFLEAGFGELDRHKHALFPDLDTARDWIAARSEGKDASNSVRMGAG